MVAPAEVTGVLNEVLHVVRALPEWLLLGVVLGVGCSLLVAGIFLLGEQLSPTRATLRQGSSGDARRRQELRQYLEAIDEQFREEQFVEGHTVAFYLPERDVVITFDARAYYRIERSGTTAVLVEHELPGTRLGSRLPFETPAVDLDVRSGRSGDPIDGAFDVLGLPPSASESAVKTAYREKVKEVHPDHGGDPEAFERVREAYTIARRAT